MLARILSMSLIAVLALGNALAHEPGYEYIIPRATVPPTIDGRLDEPLWKLFDPVEVKLVNTGGDVGDEYISDAWAAYDDRNIYVAFLNREPSPKKITTAAPGHDQDVWKDDENELFIEPANTGARPYYHIMINAENVTQDSHTGAEEDAWEPALESATSIGTDNWILEVKIPFSDLETDAAPVGESWGWNFNRHIMSGTDIWTGWSETGASFHTPERFGDLTFGTMAFAVQPTGKLATSWAAIRR